MMLGLLTPISVPAILTISALTQFFVFYQSFTINRVSNVIDNTTKHAGAN
jgi:hypothetical protein